MNEETKKEEGLDTKPEETKKEEPKKRQIILETDGNAIQLIKAEVAGSIELIAILGNMLEALKSRQNS
jgi:hypothetical protein